MGADDQQERLIKRELIRILRDHTPDIREIGRRYGPDCMATCRGDDWELVARSTFGLSKVSSEVPSRVSYQTCPLPERSGKQTGSYR